MKYTFKVNSFRNLHESKNGRQICIFTAPISNIPKDWEEWREVNVRDTNVRGEVYNAILDTLKNDPEEMIFRNLGITILAPKVEFNNKTNEVSVIFSEKDKHGIANGGHTFTAIREVLENGNNVDAEIKVECIVGELDTDERIDIVDGRNRSRATQAHTLENGRKSYEPIEKALRDPYYKDRISYSEFEIGDDNKRKDISIREILSYIYCLDGSFDKNSHPIKAYASKGAVVDFYAEEDEKGEKIRQETLVKANKILPDILKLRDLIYKELPKAYNDAGGKFNGLTTMGVIEKEQPLRFIDDVAKSSYPDGFIYPILAGFRKYIDHRGDWSWKKDPFEVWESKKIDAASAIKDAVGFSQNANKMGKASATWRMCYDAI